MKKEHLMTILRNSVHLAVGVKEPARCSPLSSVISCSGFCSGLHTASQEFVHTTEIRLSLMPSVLSFLLPTLYSSLLVSHYHFFTVEIFALFFAFLLSLVLGSSYFRFYILHNLAVTSSKLSGLVIQPFFIKSMSRIKFIVCSFLSLWCFE